ncbi:hypothetical protein LX36DRAFT_664792 [Colletotrichum falcatum]|nr:hypothetical protein LX36DRAFT_664792 [Colletotrichum falcatum]
MIQGNASWERNWFGWLVPGCNDAACLCVAPRRDIPLDARNSPIPLSATTDIISTTTSTITNKKHRHGAPTAPWPANAKDKPSPLLPRSGSGCGSASRDCDEIQLTTTCYEYMHWLDGMVGWGALRYLPGFASDRLLLTSHTLRCLLLPSNVQCIRIVDSTSETPNANQC